MPYAISLLGLRDRLRARSSPQNSSGSAPRTAPPWNSATLLETLFNKIHWKSLDVLGPPQTSGDGTVSRLAVTIDGQKFMVRVEEWDGFSS